jgi:hypothetical protein
VVSVAPIFALAIIPVLGLAGAAVDYSRANSIKVGLQAAIDATALAMAKTAPGLAQGAKPAATRWRESELRRPIPTSPALWRRLDKTPQRR